MHESFQFFFHFLLTVWCRPCTLGDWSFLAILYPAVHFWVCMWLSGIIAITNSNGDSASPSNIPLWTFASGKLFPSAVNSTLQVFMVFLIKFTISSDIYVHLETFITQLCGPYHIPFCYQSRPCLDFSVWSCSRWGCADQCRVALLCFWIFCCILSITWGKICCWLASHKSLPLFMPQVFSAL